MFHACVTAAYFLLGFHYSLHTTTSVAGIAMVTAVAVMAMEASLICYLAFGIPLVVAPWAIVQRRLINKAPTLRGQISLCHEQAARLAQLNLNFGKENNRLAAETQRLRLLQTRLNETVQRQGGNVHELRVLIQEQGTIQKQMRVRTHYVHCCCCCCCCRELSSRANGTPLMFFSVATIESRKGTTSPTTHESHLGGRHESRLCIGGRRI